MADPTTSPPRRAPLTAAHARPEPTSAHLRPVPVLSPEEHLRALELRLQGMQELSQAITSSDSVENVIAAIIREALVLLGCDRVRLFRFERGLDLLIADAACTSDGVFVEVPPDHGLLGVAVATRRPINVRDAHRDPRFDPSLDEVTRARTRSMACVPLMDPYGEVIGVLEAANKHAGYFSPEDASLLAAIGAQCAIALRQSALLHALMEKNIERGEAQAALEARQAEVELLLEIEHAAATRSTLEDALSGMLDAIVARYPAGLVAVFLMAPQERVQSGPTATQGGELTLAGSRGPLGWRTTGSQRVAFPAAHPWPRGLLADGPRLEGEALCEALHPAFEGPAWRDAWDFAIRRGPSEPVLGALLIVDCPGPDGGAPHLGMGQAARILASIAERMALAVTLSRALEEERQAERLAAIGKALSGVVHDLRTPLTVIGGYARSMEREGEPERRAEHRAVIKRQIDRIQAMIGEVLDFASGRSEVLLRRLWVRDLVTELEATFAQDMADRGIAFVVEAPYKGAVKGDLNKLLRVFANLVKNAREALEAHARPDGVRPTITLRFEEGPAGIRASVRDNGPGFPPELAGRLFTSFATHGKDHGTGLGLAMARKIATDHGGTLEATSPPGGGAVVTLTLEPA